MNQSLENLKLIYDNAYRVVNNALFILNVPDIEDKDYRGAVWNVVTAFKIAESFLLIDEEDKGSDVFEDRVQELREIELWIDECEEFHDSGLHALHDVRETLIIYASRLKNLYLDI